jgi:Tol biopolymer transport system component
MQRGQPHCGGAFDDPDSRGCLNPDWAPDGRRLAFDQYFPADGLRNIYTVNPDGSRIRQVTTGTALDEQEPDWGIAPLGN